MSGPSGSTRSPILRAWSRAPSTSLLQVEGASHSSRLVSRGVARRLVRIRAQRVDGRLRVSAGLQDAATDWSLWSERYDPGSGDLFGIQGEITGAIVRALELQLTPEEGRRLATPGTTSLEAYDLMRQGRVAWVAVDIEACDDYQESGANAARLASAYLKAVAELSEDWRRAVGGLPRPPRSVAAAWAIIDVLPAHPIITAPFAAAATGRAKPRVYLALETLEEAGVLLRLTS